MAIWTAIHPGRTHTRVLATAGVKKTLLKAHLKLQPKHIRALPTLLEALALWQGERVHAALVVGEQAASSGTSIYRDCFDLVDPTPLFQLKMVEHRRRRPDAEAAVRGMGDFRDLRQPARRMNPHFGEAAKYGRWGGARRWAGERYLRRGP